MSERFSDNAVGDFFVDRTCIDCDACRRIAPTVFAEASDHSYVARQPGSEAETRRALMALVACPTGSIGTASRQDARPAIAAFPEPVAENVSFCGFTSKDSFGAWSYFVERPEGNVLVDSPKAVGRLIAHFEDRGGIATMFLTHKDDVADHQAFARR
ncbi:MAG TPA: ferredoxin, partial [Thermoanaerobaculia bacterium]|nr:ferredoxin [Thermoanaerobaculia bacterium]